MSDNFYKKQLEQFGIESVRVVAGDADKKRQEDRRESSAATIQMIMENMHGRQWMYSMLEMARVFTSPFVAGKPDVTAYLAGAQSFGQELLDQIMRNTPDKFYLMTQEESARRINS